MNQEPSILGGVEMSATGPKQIHYLKKNGIIKAQKFLGNSQTVSIDEIYNSIIVNTKPWLEGDYEDTRKRLPTLLLTGIVLTVFGFSIASLIIHGNLSIKGSYSNLFYFPAFWLLLFIYFRASDLSIKTNSKTEYEDFYTESLKNEIHLLKSGQVRAKLLSSIIYTVSNTRTTKDEKTRRYNSTAFLNFEISQGLTYPIFITLPIKQISYQAEFKKQEVEKLKADLDKRYVQGTILSGVFNSKGVFVLNPD
jgi:hypothetical protein